MPDLRPASYVMLGMLRVGSRSGYEIKRTAEISLRFFWAVSPRQIYAELAALEEQGLIVGTDDPKGSLKRRMLEITPEGEQALKEWIADGELGAFEWRDMGLLKLFFADVATPEERRRLVHAMRVRADEVRAYFETVVLPVGERTRTQVGPAMPGVVAEFGHEFWTFMADWCERLEAELQEL